jgi:TPR repeat protein
VEYLSLAASNSADIENLALEAGIKKGGAAKGELSLAMFELANCFRNGWGVKKDPAAAKQYYETAANMGDIEAMNEVAWCYLEGFGCKKDKVSPTQQPSVDCPFGFWRTIFKSCLCLLICSPRARKACDMLLALASRYPVEPVARSSS